MTESMGNTPSPRPITARDKELYKEEYHHGVDLFKRALNEYSAADEVHKKDAFREVMDRALQVLNDTARGLKRTDLLAQNSKIREDFDSYQASQKDTEKNQLVNDLDQADKSV